MFGFKSKKPVNYLGLDVKFHIEANYHGEHGKIKVTNRKLELVEQTVAFVFPGVTTPPPMTLGLIQYIWDAAALQGYIPHEIIEYGRANDKVIAAIPGDTASVSSFRRDGAVSA